MQEVASYKKFWGRAPRSPFKSSSPTNSTPCQNVFPRLCLLEQSGTIQYYS
ncbi:Hypothetical protein FKW44_004945 [Caligus rogercresseyi]|uniref:Uncharacterized protein n=1 Tax=Caligus rogercresseyi TaxID=217165 RepID=A0A7T8HMC2_CALRO|nr:Hypothetical protein FKW44_004945 [Caligus rogercresseyi]